MTLGYIILGLLSLKPMTGYDLKTFFSKSINFFWSAELSQIYRELSNLERKGFVRYELIPQEGRPDKKIYSITDAGEKKFVEWLGEFPDNLTPVSRNEFLVRVFFSSKIPEEELVAQLTRYIKQQEKELRACRDIEEMLRKMMERSPDNQRAFHQKLTVRRGIHFAQAEIAWARECIEEIQRFYV